MMTKREVCDLLRVSTETIDRWSAQGAIKKFKSGNVVRYVRSSVEKFIQERTTK